MSFNSFLNESYVDKNFVKDFVNDVIGKETIDYKQLDEWLKLANHIGIQYDDLQERCYNYFKRDFKISDGVYSYIQETLLEMLEEKLDRTFGHNVEIKSQTNKNAKFIVNGYEIKSVKDYKSMLNKI